MSDEPTFGGGFDIFREEGDDDAGPTVAGTGTATGGGGARVRESIRACGRPVPCRMRARDRARAA